MISEGTAPPHPANFHEKIRRCSKLCYGYVPSLLDYHVFSQVLVLFVKHSGSCQPIVLIGGLVVVCVCGIRTNCGHQHFNGGNFHFLSIFRSMRT